MCQNCRLVRRGEVRSPENSWLCVFGQANPAPTDDDGIGHFSFGTLPLQFLFHHYFISSCMPAELGCISRLNRRYPRLIFS